MDTQNNGNGENRGRNQVEDSDSFFIKCYIFLVEIPIFFFFAMNTYHFYNESRKAKKPKKLKRNVTTFT